MDEKKRDIIEDYIIKQLIIATIPEKIEVLTLIMECKGTDDLQIVPDGTLIEFSKINNSLLNQIFEFLKKKEEENRIDFSELDEI